MPYLLVAIMKFCRDLVHFQSARGGRPLNVLKRSFSFGEYSVVKILQENYFLTADLKVRIFLVLALCETFENEETLKAKMLSWYIEITT